VRPTLCRIERGAIDEHRRRLLEGYALHEQQAARERQEPEKAHHDHRRHAEGHDRPQCALTAGCRDDLGRRHFAGRERRRQGIAARQCGRDGERRRPGRSRGSFSRQRWMARSTTGSISSMIVDGLAGNDSACERWISSSVLPWKARRPVNIS
jgi:hypothetical protein